MTPRSLLLLPSLILSLTAGCGHAQIYSQNAEGGVLSIHGAPKPAMKKAGEIMDSHCGAGNHSMISRDTVVVGQSTSTSSETDYSEEGGSKTETPTSSSSETQDGKAGSASTRETTVSRDVTETRLTYACGG